MRSQLSFFGQVVCLLYILLLLAHSVTFAAKYDIEGTVVGADEKVLVKLVGGKKKKTDGDGTFKLKNVREGEYTLQIIQSDSIVHEQQLFVTSDIKQSDNFKIDINSSSARAADDVVNNSFLPKSVSSTPASVAVNAEPNVSPVAVPQTAESSGGISNDFILNELNFEIKKLTAEFKHLSREMDDLKALSKMWINPLTIYSKEIILKNGSTVFGKIVYQDDKSLKVETLVGYLIIKRDEVVRIVDNVITEDQQEYVPEQIRESYAPPPMPKLTVPKYTSSNVTNRDVVEKFSANCVLMGNISEKKDSQGNIVFKGEVKNIGGRRADFVKLDFVFRKNWSGETRTLTTFIQGSYNTFDSGIVSDASLLPGALGQFELYVPQDFGSFIGYSYVIDWEEYQ